MMITVLVTEILMGQNYDYATDVANQIIQPPRLESSVVDTFVLKGKMVHDDDALDEHHRPEPKGILGYVDERGCAA